MKKKGFFDFFPVPATLAIPAVGLSLSDDAIRFVELEKTPTSLRLKRYGEKVLPASVIRSGQVDDPHTLIEILKEFKKRFNLNFVYTTLPEEKAYLFQTEIPAIDPKEIHETIEFKIEENVPLSLSEVVFDYRVISKDISNSLEVVVCVLPGKMARVYLDVLKSAGLSPLSLEIESQAIARAVVKEGNDSGVLVVNINHFKTAFSIVSQGIVHFSSTIPRGSESLFGGAPAQAAKTLSSDARGKAYTSLSFNQETALVFTETIQKFLSYWQAYRGNSDQTSIERIIMCGDHAADEDFANFLSSKSGISVEVGNIWTNAFTFEEEIPTLRSSDSLNYVAAAGLALSSHV
ncbi:MAG: pilus assembly protein PilM [Patescibacteria group bacterium]